MQTKRTESEQEEFLAISQANHTFRCVVLPELPVIPAMGCVLRQDKARLSRNTQSKCLACGDGELVARAIRCTLPAIPTVEVPIATLTKPTSEK